MGFGPLSTNAIIHVLAPIVSACGVLVGRTLSAATEGRERGPANTLTMKNKKDTTRSGPEGCAAAPCSPLRYTVISQNLGNSCPDIIAPVVEDGTQDRPTPSVRWVKCGADVLLEWWCRHRGWVEIPFVPNAHSTEANNSDGKHFCRFASSFIGDKSVGKVRRRRLHAVVLAANSGIGQQKCRITSRIWLLEGEN